MKASILVVSAPDDAADLDVGEEPQQEQRALDAAEFAEGTVEQVAAAVCAELAQQSTA
jgi:hypothetical protein